MALTIAKTTNGSGTFPVVGDALKFIPLRLTFDSSYPTGGEAIVASSYGLSRIIGVIGGLDTTGAYALTFVSTTGKLLVITTADGLQVADTTSLATVVFEVVVIGL